MGCCATLTWLARVSVLARSGRMAFLPCPSRPSTPLCPCFTGQAILTHRRRHTRFALCSQPVVAPMYPSGAREVCTLCITGVIRVDARLPLLSGEVVALHYSRLAAEVTVASHVVGVARSGGVARIFENAQTSTSLFAGNAAKPRATLVDSTRP